MRHRAAEKIIRPESRNSFRTGFRSSVIARFDFGPLLRIEDLVLSLQDARRVADALGTPLAYRPQGQDPLDVERVQLVGVSQGLEQLVQAPRQPPGICHRVEQFEALYLFFVTQHLLVSFSQCSCTVKKQETENKR